MYVFLFVGFRQCRLYLIGKCCILLVKICRVRKVSSCKIYNQLQGETFFLMSDRRNLLGFISVVPTVKFKLNQSSIYYRNTWYFFSFRLYFCQWDVVIPSKDLSFFTIPSFDISTNFPKIRNPLQREAVFFMLHRRYLPVCFPRLNYRRFRLEIRWCSFHKSLPRLILAWGATFPDHSHGNWHRRVYEA